MRRFHLAFPVSDIDRTVEFYTNILGCKLGRTADRWADFDFFGHQLSAHLVDTSAHEHASPVDNDRVPIPHFGVILGFAQFEELAVRLAALEVTFLIPPRTRFAGLPGEQRTMFFRDPSGNAIEIKAYADDAQVFEI